MYDLTVVGAGPGGYVAAIRAAQLGKKVAIIEQGPLGGACLNVGCIPSKTFLKHAEWMLTLKEANHSGIANDIKHIDIRKLVKRKIGVVKSLQGGIDHLLKKNNITHINGKASFNASQQLEVNGKRIDTQRILLAVGSTPFIPPIAGLDSIPYDTTDSFFDLESLPSRLVVIGGGVIGVELAFAMAPLGIDTTIVEVAPDILLTEDKDAREVIKQSLQQLGIKVIVNAKIKEAQKGQLVLADTRLPFDRLLVSTGRKANLELPQQLGLKLDERGKFIKINERYVTSNAKVYAIGDVIGGAMLAHAASDEGITAVDSMFGHGTPSSTAHLVPRGVYSFPEIGSIGLSEEQALAKYGKNEVVIKQQPFAANGKAISANETSGFVKLIAHKQYGEILGAVIVGAHATEMIHTVQSAMQAEATIDELAAQVFAHPTLSEVIGETAKSVLFKAIHE